MTTPAQPEKAPATALDFFNSKDDTQLAELWGANKVVETEKVAEEPAAPVVPSVPITPPPQEAAPTSPPPAVEVELPTLPRQPMTEFAVFDNEGELEIPDIKIKFKAKGQERELPLDRVVRLAQFGFSNEEREQQVLAARKFVSEAQEKEQAYQAQAQQYESYYQQLFSDPGFYEEARLAYMQEHTPEMRARRAEQQLQHERQQVMAERENAHVQGFVQGTLAPTVQNLLAANPHVTEYEVIGRYTDLTYPLLVNGRVPVNRLPEVERLVKNDLAAWVEQQNTVREIDKQSHAQAQAKSEAEAVQKVAQTKRQAARMFAHQGTPAPMGEPPKPIKYGSAQDWLKATFPATE